MRIAILLLLAAVVAGGAVYYARGRAVEEPVSFRTAEVQKGNLLITIGATGTVEPRDVIDVGAQVMGRIKYLGVDPRAATDPALADKRIDYNSPVEEGTLLAQIDDSLYRATRNQAKAGLDRAQADLLQLKAKLVQTEAEWKRAQRLRELKLTSLSGLGTKNGKADGPTMIKGISDSDFILAKANYEVAQANVAVGESVVEQQQATLDSAETNLGYTQIKSPVRGTIIDRRVNVGQTVVASLNAPSLFLIAKDLRQMEVWTSVNEADIGRLKVGQPVRFTVDAFPGEEFEGTISQIRLNATMTSNVVTYPVVVSTDNSSLRLLPYLTADVKFEVDRRDDVLLVPNAALRYQPRPQLVLPADESEKVAEAAPPGGAKGGVTKTLWLRKGSMVAPIEVVVGTSDGTMTEILRGPIKEGDEIVLGENRDEPTTETTNNPFAPPRFRGTKAPEKKS